MYATTSPPWPAEQAANAFLTASVLVYFLGLWIIKSMYATFLPGARPVLQSLPFPCPRRGYYGDAEKSAQ